jgi:linoleoyl-CoA desaturase
MKKQINRPKFPLEEPGFYNVLKQRVKDHLDKKVNKGKADSSYFIKILILSLAFAGTYSLIYFIKNREWVFVIYGFLGILSIVLAINTAHDAAHGCVFRDVRHNRLLMHVFELFGTSSAIWKSKHVGSHHLYPNVPGHDSDIGQSKIARIFPSDPFRPIHAYQHIYMPLLYTLYLFRWIFYRDFKDALTKSNEGRVGAGIKKAEIVKLVLFKVLFLCYMIVIPTTYAGHSLSVIAAGFVLFTITGSLTIAIVLLSTHVGREVEFPLPDTNGNLPFAWARHQLETTSDFAPENFLLTHLTGGFNHHVVHHLFPNVCHIHYPGLTPILSRTAAEFGLPYKHFRSLAQAVRSHFSLLKQNSSARIPVSVDTFDF